MANVPQQVDGCSCGVYMLIGIEMVMEGYPLLHDERIVDHQRMRLAIEIADGSLNY